MKKGVFSILAILAVFAMVTLGCPDGSTPKIDDDKDIVFEAISQDGKATSTTTQVYLDFDRQIGDLTKENITITDPDKTGFEIKGAITRSGARYTVKSNPVKKGGKLTVEVAKEGYNITTKDDKPMTVTVFYSAPAPGATEVSFTGVTSNGTKDTTSTTELTLTFSAAVTGLTKSHITLSGVEGVVIDPDKPFAAGSTGATYTLPIKVTKTAGKLTVEVANPSGYAIQGATKPDIDIHYAKEVTFSSLTQDGSAKSTTTLLNLSFDSIISGLGPNDIALSGVAGVVKGTELKNPGGSFYQLPISGFTASGTLTVKVTKAGYNILNSEQTVPIFYHAEEVAFVSLTADGGADTATTTKLTLAFDKTIEGLSASDITLSDTNAIMGLLTSGTKDADGNFTYTLPIRGFTVDEDGKATLTVTVSKGHSYTFDPPSRDVEIYLVEIPVAFSDVTANGSPAATTTALTLTFDQAIEGLTATDITLEGRNDVTKGILGVATDTDTGSITYNLPINGFNDDDSLKVTVSKFGYKFNPTFKNVSIYFSKKAVVFEDVIANGSATETTTALTLTFDELIEGLTADDITLSGVDGVVKGTLADGTGASYILPIDGFTTGGELIVAVAKAGYTITGSPTTVEIYFHIPEPTAVTFSELTANGDANTTTTALTLTFSKAITGLSASNITLSGVAGVAKGTLAGTGPAYTLPISGFAAGGTLTVEIGTIAGYTITPTSKTVAIFYKAAGNPFDDADAIKELTATSGGPVTVDIATGIIARPVDTGYGNYFSIGIPADQLPIIPSDTIVIKYIGNGGSAPITPKTKGSSGNDDLDPVSYPSWTGNNTVQTMRIPAVNYKAAIPTEVLWFQGRPNTTAWEFKVISISVEHGDSIKVTTAVGIKPVSAGNPVTELDNLQYSGTVSWSPSVTTTFTAGTVYTATISLTAKTGYTFAGIDANTFQVTGADTVTHVVGVDTLSISAVFPATAAPAPDKVVEFVNGDVKGPTTGNDIGQAPIITVDSASQYSVESYAKYDSSYTYFSVTFDSGVKLSDYAKISFTVETSSGSIRWKGVYVLAYGTGDTIPGSLPKADVKYVIASQASGNPISGYGENKINLPLSLDPTNLQKDSNSILVAINVPSDDTNKAEYKIKDVKFFN